MKNLAVFGITVALASGSIASPVTIKTKDGRIYDKAEITDRNPYEITVVYEGLTARIHLEDLSEDLQKEFNYDPKAAIAWHQADISQAMAKELKAAQNGSARLNSELFPAEVLPLILKYNAIVDASLDENDGTPIGKMLGAATKAQKKQLVTALADYLTLIRDTAQRSSQEANALRQRVGRHEIWPDMPKAAFAVSHGLPLAIKPGDSESGELEEIWIYFPGEKDLAEPTKYYLQNGRLKH